MLNKIKAGLRTKILLFTLVPIIVLLFVVGFLFFERTTNIFMGQEIEYLKLNLTEFYDKIQGTYFNLFRTGAQDKEFIVESTKKETLKHVKREISSDEAGVEIFILDENFNVLVENNQIENFELTNMVKNVIEDEKNVIFAYQNEEGKGYVFSVRYFAPWKWYLGFAITEEMAFADIYNLFFLVIAMVIGIIIIVGLILFIVTNRLINKPLKESMGILENVSKGDLSKRFQINSNDELGIFFSHFNKVVASLNSIVNRIKKVTYQSKEISSNLESSSKDSAASLENINTNIIEIKDRTVNLDQEIMKSNQSADDVKTFISNVVQQINSQASAINESSASIEQMSASIKNIANTSEEKMNIANVLEERALSGEVEMKKTVEIIKKVANSANLIMEMIDVINDIAAQTNLLSLNAAIEAAHAGESGKGFAVVAQQIRKLSEKTTKNAKEISTSLKAVLGDIKISEESTDNTGKLFASIVERIKDVAASMMEIRNSMHELTIGSGQINEALGELMDISTNVKESSDEMDEKVHNIHNSIKSISSISTNVREEVEEVTDVVKGLVDSVEDVSDAGEENAKSITLLDEIVGNFKVNEQEDDNDTLGMGLKE